MAIDLHKTALDAEKSLEALATGLAHLGADEATVKGVSQMAEVTRKIAVEVNKAGQGPAAPAQAAPQPQPAHTMESATNSMQGDLAAARSGGGGSY